LQILSALRQMGVHVRLRLSGSQ